MTKKKMHLATVVFNALGSSAYAWLEDGVNPHDYADIHAIVRVAQLAERGKMDFLFLGDFLAQTQRNEAQNPGQTLEPTVVATAIAMATQRIGIINTVSTTYAEPYNIARVLKSLDVISGGRMGWNAVTTSAPDAAANFGRAVENRETRYARASEVVQIVQALWGSWGEDAWLADKQSRRFTDMSKIVPVGLQGQYVASQGPLEIPPSRQGQPVISHSGASRYTYAFAGQHANVVISEVFTIDEGRRHRASLRQAAAAAGRDPDTVKFFAGVMPTIAESHAEALARRARQVEPDIQQRVLHLGQLLGVPLRPGDLDRPLSAAELNIARAHPGDTRSYRALQVAREGWTVREVLHHGVIDFHPAPIGRPDVIADHLQEWFEAGAADGFWFLPDVYADGMAAFVDGVIPILQQRGLFRTEYEGETLRDHLGIERQYGLPGRPISG